MNAAELQTIVADRPPDCGHATGWDYWGGLLRSRNMIALCVMYIPNCMIFYFCITWLPTYLRQRHGFDATSLGIFSGLPLIVSMPGDLLGGLVTDRLASRYGLRVGRCGLGAAAYVIAGLALLFAAASSTPIVAATLIALATGMTMFTLGAAWGTVIEVGRNHVGVVGATMNSVGNLAAMLNPLIVAYSVQWFGSWNLPLYLMGSLFLLGACCWTLVDPTRPVFGGGAGSDSRRAVTGYGEPILFAWRRQRLTAIVPHSWRSPPRSRQRRALRDTPASRCAPPAIDKASTSE